jgi:hypothetical protein
LTRRQPKPVQEHTHLAIRVESFSASVSAGINRSLYGDRPKDIVGDEQIVESSIGLEVRGVCTYPPPRADQKFEITVHTENPAKAGLRVKDVHRRDENNVPQYQKKRDQLYPVYDLPPGLGLIERRRGNDVWTGWIFVEPQVVTNMLILLGQTKPSYLSINERRIERHRWIWHISLQTTDPAAE